jgi:hypothetical protein
VSAVGPDRNKHLRNIAIVIGLALVVWLVPGGARAGATVSNLLGLIFVGGLLFLGYRIYMERRDEIFGLEERQRGMLYGCLALATIALVGTSRMWQTGLGAIVWLALLGVAVMGLYRVWQSHRAY